MGQIGIKQLIPQVIVRLQLCPEVEVHRALKGGLVREGKDSFLRKGHVACNLKDKQESTFQSR